MYVIEIVRKEIQTLAKSKVLIVEIISVYLLLGIAPVFLLYFISLRPDFTLAKMLIIIEIMKNMPSMLAVSCASILAADSFAGEKERRTIETLLASPVPDHELFLGKVYAIFLPLFLLSESVFAALTFIVQYVSSRANVVLAFPSSDWLIAGLIMAPLFLLLSIGVVALVSMYVKTSREAVLSMFLVLIPLVFMALGPEYLNIKIDTDFMIRLTLAICAVDILVAALGSRLFNRNLIMSSL